MNAVECVRSYFVLFTSSTTASYLFQESSLVTTAKLCTPTHSCMHRNWAIILPSKLLANLWSEKFKRLIYCCTFLACSSLILKTESSVGNIRIDCTKSLVQVGSCKGRYTIWHFKLLCNGYERKALDVNFSFKFIISRSFLPCLHIQLRIIAQSYLCKHNHTLTSVLMGAKMHDFTHFPATEKQYCDQTMLSAVARLGGFWIGLRRPEPGTILHSK